MEGCGQIYTAAALDPGAESPYLLDRGCVSPRADLDVLEKKNVLILPGMEPLYLRSSVPWPSFDTKKGFRDRQTQLMYITIYIVVATCFDLISSSGHYFKIHRRIL